MNQGVLFTISLFYLISLQIYKIHKSHKSLNQSKLIKIKSQRITHYDTKNQHLSIDKGTNSKLN